MKGLILFLAIGIALGPSGLGFAVPGPLAPLMKLCAVGFLLLAGLELSFKGLKQNWAVPAGLAAGAFAAPFLFGFTLAPWLGATTFTSRWILATAMAVSALPVAIQILKEQRLYETQIGQLVVTAACLCDIAAWVCFMAVLPSAHQAAWADSHLPVLFFLGGVVISALMAVPPALMDGLKTASRGLFAPVFFIGLGLKINLWGSFDLGLTLAITAVAMAGKVLGVAIVAPLLKLPRYETLVAGLSLNARGAMEILLAILAFDSGLINATWLTSLMMMALLTSVIAGPLLSRADALRRAKARLVL